MMNGIVRHPLSRQTCFLGRRRSLTTTWRNSVSSLVVRREGVLGACTLRRSDLPSTTIRSLAGGGGHSLNHSSHLPKKNKVVAGGGGTKITVIPVLSPENYEMEEYDKDDVMKMEPPKSINAFFKTLGEAGWGGEDEDTVLKIYNSSTDEWEELLGLEQIQREHKSAKKVFVAPDHGEEEEEEEEDFNFGDYDDNGMEKMEETILDLVTELKEEGWKLGEGLVLENQDGLTRTTKDMILEKAAEDTLLQSFLLRHVGSLDHIAQCLQYKFVWDRTPTDEKQEEDDEIV